MPRLISALIIIATSIVAGGLGVVALGEGITALGRFVEQSWPFLACSPLLLMLLALVGRGLPPWLGWIALMAIGEALFCFMALLVLQPLPSDIRERVLGTFAVFAAAFVVLLPVYRRFVVEPGR